MNAQTGLRGMNAQTGLRGVNTPAAPRGRTIADWVIFAGMAVNAVVIVLIAAVYVF